MIDSSMMIVTIMLVIVSTIMPILIIFFLFKAITNANITYKKNDNIGNDGRIKSEVNEEEKFGDDKGPINYK